MQDDMQSDLSRPMRCVLLKGVGFISNGFAPRMPRPKNYRSEDQTDIPRSILKYYRSDNQAIIQRFIKEYFRQPDNRPLIQPSFIGFVPVGVSDAEVDEEGLPIFYAVDSDSPEVNGRFYLDTLDLMKEDLSQQFRHRIRACRQDIVSIEVQGTSIPDRPGLPAHKMPPGWGHCSSKETALFNNLIHSFERLERPAFTFGARGRSLWITATLKSGSKEWFVLRPLVIDSLRCAQTMKNPPLPPALWRWVNGF